ncbi:Transmembrane osmosensor [Phlyctochytrium planicorne]|nr:Transmembrane osmosensor [Phlyctochytrium planicorne]
MPANISNLTSNVFLLGLLGLHALGWFLFFIGACITSKLFDSSRNPTWFYSLFHIAAFFGLVGATVFDLVKPYRVPITAFLTAGFTFCVGVLQQANVSANLPDGVPVIIAGNIFLVLVYIPLIFIFGADETSPISIASSSGFPGEQQARGTPAFNFPSFPMMGKNAGSPASSQVTAVPTAVAPPPPMAYMEQQPPAQTYAPVAAAYPPVAAAAPVLAAPASAVTAESRVPAPAAAPAAEQAPAAVPFVCKAKALYNYNASADDPKEISFSKGDILEILDNKGKWWHARRINADGTEIIGIAPSNYLQVV